MKKFRFRLQRVLEYRTRVKEEYLQELQRRNFILRELEEKCQLLEKEFTRNALHPEVISHEELQLKSAYAARLEGEIANVKLAILDAEAKVDEALAQHRRAAQEEEALLKVRKRKKHEFDEHVLHEEMKFLDELSVQKGNTLHEKDDQR